MEERNLIQPHRIRWYRFPAAPLNARYPQTAISRLRPFWSFPTRGGSHSIFSLIGPLGSESQLSIVRFYSVLQMILRTLRSIPLFCYAKRGYLALHHPKPRTNRFPVDDGELAAACAIAFRKQCLLWCLARRACSKNCMLSAPKQRLTF